MNVLLMNQRDCLAKTLFEELIENHIDTEMVSQKITYEELLPEVRKSDIIFYFLEPYLLGELQESGMIEQIRMLIKSIEETKRKITIIIVSWEEAQKDSELGTQLRECEEEIITWTAFLGQRLYIYRLDHVIEEEGCIKECQMITDFYHSILELKKTKQDHFVFSYQYVEDVIASFLNIINEQEHIPSGYVKIRHTYQISVKRVR